jgi:outer membrane immunogenic protein
MKTLLASIVACLLPVAALAADGPGIYVGVFGGGEWISHNVELLDYDHNGNDAVFGIQVGHDHRVKQLLFGVEADFTPSDVGASDHVLFSAGSAASTTDITHTIKNFTTIRGKVGRAFGMFVPYGTVGLALARNESTAAAVITGFGPLDGTYRGKSVSNRQGWTVGAGMAVPFMSMFSVKVDYLYADLGEETDVTLPTLDPAPRTHAITANIVRVGVGVTF